MKIRFLKITQAQAYQITGTTGQVYTACHDSSNQYYIYKPSYTTTELPNTIEIGGTQLNGLTPIDPSRPMFPKK